VATKTALTPAVVERIDALRQPGLTGAALHRALLAEGIKISRGSLHTYLHRGASPDVSAAAELERQAEGAVASGDLAHLTRVRDALAGAMATWRPHLGRDGSAVRAYATLSRALADITARLLELAPPPPPDPELDPAHVAAKRRLLERADEELARGA
jgi:hypothetical protein